MNINNMNESHDVCNEENSSLVSLLKNKLSQFDLEDELDYIVSNKNKQTINFLINNHHVRVEDVCFAAIRCGKIDILKDLLNTLHHCLVIGYSVVIALKRGYYDVTKLLINHKKASVMIDYVLDYIKDIDFDAFIFLLKCGVYPKEEIKVNINTLFAAYNEGQYEIVNKLIDCIIIQYKNTNNPISIN